MNFSSDLDVGLVASVLMSPSSAPSAQRNAYKLRITTTGSYNAVALGLRPNGTLEIAVNTASAPCLNHHRLGSARLLSPWSRPRICPWKSFVPSLRRATNTRASYSPMESLRGQALRSHRGDLLLSSPCHPAGFEIIPGTATRGKPARVKDKKWLTKETPKLAKNKTNLTSRGHLTWREGTTRGSSYASGLRMVSTALALSPAGYHDRWGLLPRGGG